MNIYKILSIVTILIFLIAVPTFVYGQTIDENKLPEGCYNAPDFPYEFKGNYAITQDRVGYSQGVRYGVIDKDYNLIIKPEYLQITFDDNDHSIIYAMMKIAPFGAYGDIYIDKNGKLEKINKQMYYRNFTIQYDDNTFGYTEYFGNGEYIAVENDDLQFGVLNRSGDTVIPFTSEFFYMTHNSIISRYKIKSKNNLDTPYITDGVIISPEGEILSKTYDFIEFTEDKIIVTKNKKMNMLNNTTYQEVFPTWHDIFGYSKEKGIYYMDYGGDFIYLNDTTTNTPQVTATLPSFKITINGTVINNNERLYPFIVYKDITYFPMTYYDSRFLNLETHWNNETGLKINKLANSPIYSPDSSKGSNSTSFTAYVADFDIYVNNKKIDNANEPYPLLLYRDVTYFPMTWRFGVDEFGWDYHYSNDNGLVINSK